MIKAVIDTNVIVSAYITKNLEAATSKLWEAVLQCKLTPIYNEEILSEYSEVLRRKKFGIPEHLVKWALDKIVSNGVRGERVLSDEFFPDPKDVVFYGQAIQSIFQRSPLWLHLQRCWRFCNAKGYYRADV